MVDILSGNGSMVDILASAEDSKLGKLGTAEQFDEREQKCEEGMLDMLLEGTPGVLIKKHII